MQDDKATTADAFARRRMKMLSPDLVGLIRRLHDTGHGPSRTGRDGNIAGVNSEIEG